MADLFGLLNRGGRKKRKTSSRLPSERKDKKRGGERTENRL